MICNEELVKDVGILFDRKIILYGASKSGVRALQQLKMAGLEVEAFADSNEKKWGTHFLGKRVLSLDELSKVDKNNKDIAIFISSVFIDEISKTLDELQIGKGHTYTINAFIYSLYFKNNFDKVKTRLNVRYKDDGLNMTYIIKNKMWFHDGGTFITQENLQRLLFQEDPVLIFQPGKVGSTTIFRSLKKKKYNVIHCHDIEWLLQFQYKCQPPLYSQADYQCIRDGIRAKENLKIITGVREPINRDLSSIFEGLSGWNYIEKYMGKLNEKTICDYCMEELSRKINKAKRSDSLKLRDEFFGYNWFINRAYGEMFDWFDMEIKTLFDIDIYDYPFDKEKGYSIITKNNIEILIYRLEDLSKLEKYIGDFIGCTDFRLESQNVGSKKVYASLYQEVRESIMLPKNYVEFYYKNNPRMDHFYTEEEKSKFLEKWKIEIE